MTQLWFNVFIKGTETNLVCKQFASTDVRKFRFL